MKLKIVLMSYPYMTDMVREVVLNLTTDVPIEIVDVGIGYQRRLAEKLDEDPSVQVLIALRGHAQFLPELKQTSLIVMDVTWDDLLQAYLHACQIADRIVVMRYGKVFEEYSKFDVLFPLEIIHDCYEDEFEAREKVMYWMRQGISTFVGTSVACSEAAACGAKAILLYSKKTIRESLERAISIIRSLEMDRVRLEKINALIQSTNHAILSTDAQGHIDLINAHGCRLLKTTEAEATKWQITDVFPALPLDKVFVDGQSIDSYVTRVGQHDLVVSVNPIHVHGKIVGSVLTLQESSKVRDVERKIRKELSQKGLIARYRFSDILHRSREMERVIERANVYAQTDATVLIQGETGTGKELFAQSIHNASSRAGQPFVAINCSALPEHLLESELFGYEEGAFTGAKRGGKRGLFELAHCGTLFLDEIGEITPSLQSRLLRVLQEKEIMRVGGTAIIPIDVRIMTATNKDLRSLMVQGKFREDLFYRLNMLHLHLPPLREREGDVILLSDHFLQRYNIHGPDKEQLLKKIESALHSYHWKGNVRELEVVIQRIAVLFNHTGKIEMVDEILNELTEENECKQASSRADKRLKDEIQQAERQKIHRILAEVGWNKEQAAQRLGISRTTLWRKLKKFESLP